MGKKKEEQISKGLLEGVFRTTQAIIKSLIDREEDKDTVESSQHELEDTFSQLLETRKKKRKQDNQMEE